MVVLGKEYLALVHERDLEGVRTRAVSRVLERREGGVYVRDRSAEVDGRAGRGAVEGQARRGGHREGAVRRAELDGRGRGRGPHDLKARNRGRNVRGGGGTVARRKAEGGVSRSPAGE